MAVLGSSWSGLWNFNTCNLINCFSSSITACLAGFPYWFMACRTVMLLYTPNLFFCLTVSEAWNNALLSLLNAFTAMFTHLLPSLNPVGVATGPLERVWCRFWGASPLGVVSAYRSWGLYLSTGLIYSSVSVFASFSAWISFLILSFSIISSIIFSRIVVLLSVLPSSSLSSSLSLLLSVLVSAGSLTNKSLSSMCSRMLLSSSTGSYAKLGWTRSFLRWPAASLLRRFRISAGKGNSVHVSRTHVRLVSRL